MLSEPFARMLKLALPTKRAWKQRRLPREMMTRVNDPNRTYTTGVHPARRLDRALGCGGYGFEGRQRQDHQRRREGQDQDVHQEGTVHNPPLVGTVMLPGVVCWCVT